ncbi:MAG TPA: lipoyl(octanoyl) transferase LipB [Nitrososphaerales archaeon]|nr:lipoyl(octanoyl) transferase LipB [Nitrososphaerales archaeon]
MSAILLDLGRKEYGQVWELQKQLVAARAADRVQDTLILVEHEPVITLGRKTTPENFKPQNIPVFKVERGGDATLHAPGQLVGYPIIKLVEPDVHKFLRQLEEVLIRTASDLGVAANRKEGHTGVWSGEKKFASIGVAVTNWVTYHGFALNVSTDLSYFRLIRPCGLDPETITSMEKLAGRDFSMHKVKEEVVSNFSEVFGTRLAPESLAHLNLSADGVARAE